MYLKILRIPISSVPIQYWFYPYKSDALCDLVTFLKFKKTWKKMRESILVKLQAKTCKVTLFRGCLHVFKIVNVVPNCAKRLRLFLFKQLFLFIYQQHWKRKVCPNLKWLESALCAFCSNVEVLNSKPFSPSVPAM